jgi:tetratricopeptide (TPR) repeat protein
MSAKRRKQIKPKIENSSAAEPVKTASQPHRPAISRRRKWLFRLGTAIFAPLLFLALLEGGLRLGGYGNPTSFFLGPQPDGAYTTNPRFGQRFFPPALARSPVPSFINTKPSSTIRIFVLGSSAAQGVPNPSYSFGRILDVMLQDRYPGVKFEVINAAMTAINSHVTLEIARDCAAFQPDLFVVYMGNNEIVGPYGPGTVFQQWSPSLNFIRANIWLKSTRTGQLLSDAMHYFHSQEGSDTWRGMEMFLGNQVTADDPRLTAVYENFRQNVNDICNVGHRAGAAVILSTVAVNLRDCPPLASQHRSDMSAEDLTKWKSIYQAGIEREAKNEWAEAIAEYQAASKIDDHFADLEFRLGRCCEALNRQKEARECFIAARDLDALRFRADSKINAAIRKTAAENTAANVLLADAENTLSASDLAANGIPGANLFYEHVHMNFDGNYLLAKTILDQVESALSQLAASRRQGPVLTKQQCAESLTLTLWDEYQMADQMLKLFSRPPFTNQIDHDVRLASMQSQVKNLHQLAFAPEALKTACRSYEAVLNKTPENFLLRHQFGKLLLDCDQPEKAAEQLRIVRKKNPSEPMAYIDLGRALLMRERINEAIAQYRKALELDPGNVMAFNNLGRAFDNCGRSDEAIAQFQKAVEIDPEFSLAYFNLGVVLSRKNQLAEAITQYQKAIKIDPLLATAYNNLGDALNRQGHIEQAVQHFRKAVEIDPQFALAHNNLAVDLNQLGYVDQAFSHFQKAVEFSPRYMNARLNLGGMLASQGKFDEAIVHYRKAVEIEPKNAMAYYVLGKALASSGRKDDAIVNFQRALEIRPDFAAARQDLQALAGRAPEAQ